MKHVRPVLSTAKALDKLHRDVLNAFERALEAANPRAIIRRNVKVNRGILVVGDIRIQLQKYGKVFVIGAGKASGYMAEEVERLLGSRITSGRVIIPDYQRPWPTSRRIMYLPGSHPVPSKKNIEGAMQMLALAERARSDDLVIMLLSGGASALMEYPLPGLTLRDETTTTDLLLKSGANIQEINTVRKHTSRVRGGRLAETISGRILTLIVSDVVGDELDAVGSGPTVPDPTSYHDAKKVLDKYALWSRVPVRVRNLIEQGIRGAVAETPKNNKGFKRVNNVLVGSNRESCLAAARLMKEKGYGAHILSTHVRGEAREVGRFLGSILADIRNNEFFSPPVAFIAGGETTVTVNGKGKGGRNQELALSAAVTIAGSKNVVVGSIGTDGVDGPTDAAGAICDGTTVPKGWRRGMDPEAFLENNDSYSYLSKLGDLVKTGPTGTNVNDIMIITAR
jgi:glycerate 2-kinase